ncbi:hypothetical protein GGR56DRAFT_673267 [Xylariaceae sp. FL0804]|nr:hypothetical protein GGR56DRAFT_673267 [Xylariaceae sp. FL0804]
MSLNPALGLACPSGGDAYVCANLSSSSQFVGCCTADPCSTGGMCAADALRPATYDPQANPNLPAQDCMASTGDGGGGGAADAGVVPWWYTCADTSPPFLGCCTVDACESDQAGGCPLGNVSIAVLAPGAANGSSGPFVVSSSSSSLSSSITALTFSDLDPTSSSTTTSATDPAMSSQMAAEAAATAAAYRSVKIGVGVALPLLLAAGLGVLWLRHRYRLRRRRDRLQRNAIISRPVPLDDLNKNLTTTAGGRPLGPAAAHYYGVKPPRPPRPSESSSLGG